MGTARDDPSRVPDKGSPASSLFKDDFSLMVSGSVGQVSPVRVASAGSLEIGRLAAGATFRRSHAADNVPRRLGCRASQAFTQHHRDLLQRSEDLPASQSRRRSHLTAFQDVSLGGPIRSSAIGTWLGVAQPSIILAVSLPDAELYTLYAH